MKYRLAVASVLLGIVLTSAATVLTRIVRIAELEQPPCGACSQLYSTSEIPSVKLSELKHKREQYEGKVVRVRAILRNDAGQIHLEDFGNDEGIVPAVFSESCRSCVGATKALAIYSGYRVWYDGSAHVVVLGRINHDNPALYYYENGFHIDCLESAEPIGFAGYNRVRYAAAEVLKVLLR